MQKYEKLLQRAIVNLNMERKTDEDWKWGGFSFDSPPFLSFSICETEMDLQINYEKGIIWNEAI